MEEYLKYFELLELTPEAAIKEIRKNYNYLKNLYSGDPVEITALNEDFSEELRHDYLSRLDEAYEQLSLLLENRKPAVPPRGVVPDDELRRWIGGIDCFTGAALRSVRERLGVDLKDIFAVTRIQPHHLEDIENEVFDSFHAEVYLRSFITEYTHFLSLDTRKVLADYMPRYREWAETHEGHCTVDVVDLLTKLA